MALTAQEDAELRQLEQEQSQYEAQKQGSQALDQFEQPAIKPRKPDQTAPFSLYRATVGGLRDAAQNVEDFVFDVAPYAPGFGAPGVALSPEVQAPIHKALTLPGLKGEQNAGTAESITRNLVSFVAPFSVYGKALGMAKAATWLGRAGRAMAAGAAVDAMMDPKTTNLVNVLHDGFGLDLGTLNSLASEDDDNRLVARFKAAAVNAPVGLAADAFFEAGLRGVRAYRAWRGSLSEADAAVKSVREDMPVEAPPPVEEATTSTEPRPSNASGTTEAVAANDNVFNPFKDTNPDAAKSADAEDILTFLQRKAAAGASEEDIKAFAERLAAHPEEGFSKLAGINPLKVDFSALDDPEMLGRLHEGLQGVYEGIANRLGRTGETVTEEMTARAARVLATSSDVLKDLYGHTANLDSIMYASQSLVGAHAQKLLGLAQRALEAAKAGAGDGEWADFLEAFHRQAYFLGALRGAGSEVGRALRSLQHIQKVGIGAAKRGLTAATEASAANEAAAAKVGAKEIAAKATDAVSKMTDPSERILFLGKVLDKGGDIGELNRFTRTKAGSLLQRLKLARGELRGNLFTAATALTNVGSALGMQGLRAMAMGLATIPPLLASPFSRKMAQAARVQAMATWFYVEGNLGAWRSAWANMFHVLQREGMEEVVLNAEAFGAKGLAKRAAMAADSARADLGAHSNFERIEVSNRTRSFVMNSADMRAMQETIQSWNTPKLMEHSLMWFLKTIRPAVNAAGSLSRLGTILFVNAADEFGGTLVAKAGAQAEAIRIAAHEAAEHQLEGKALSDYLKARMVQLTETVDGFADDSYSAGKQEAALATGDVEAKGALFQDPLEVFTGVPQFLNKMPLGDILVPFVKTPLRILERTAIDFTPLGLLKDRVRADIMAGGWRRDEALARIGLGMLMTYSAFQLAEDRGIVGNDGGYGSSARLARPSYTLRVGGDTIEYKRFDPVGTLLGWGADLRAYLDDQKSVAPADRGSTAEQYVEAAIWATQANVLSKTWLAGLKDIVDLVSSVNENQSSDGWARYASQLAQRFVPAAGIQKQFGKGIPGVDHEAGNFMEGLLKTSFGADKLPVKRDALGDPVPVENGDRLLGFKVGPDVSAIDDPLHKEMDNLSFDLGRPTRSFHGVRLNSEEFSRYLQLRGQVVQKDGLTMKERLSQLIQLPEYQALPRAGRVQAMRDAMKGYSDAAAIQLVQERHDLAKRVVANQVWDKGLLEGLDDGTVDRQTQELFQQLGLTGDEQPTPDPQQ